MPDKPTAYDPLIAILAKLVPENGVVEVATVDGKKLSLNTTLPARRQVLVARALERLLRRSVIAGLPHGGSRDVMAQLVGLVNDDGAMAELSATFLAAYPDALPAGTDPLDVLSIEEVVAAIVPLIAGPAIRLLGMAGPLGELPGLATAGGSGSPPCRPTRRRRRRTRPRSTPSLGPGSGSTPSGRASRAGSPPLAVLPYPHDGGLACLSK